jgi:tRNA pseudouridine38-40 synthase
MAASIRVRLDLAYDGTDFAGWQRQPDQATVQSRLEAAVGRLYRQAPGHRTPLVAAGRTDAGVHAEGQVAHFDAPVAIPPAGIRAGLNRLLPDSIRVLEAAEAAPGFHARFDAIGKTYRYHLLTGAEVSPLRTRYAWPVGDRLSREAMEDGAARLVGRHDFRAFFTAPPGEEPATPIRNVFAARFLESGDDLVFEVFAEGFLRYMVRRMVGALVAVGRGQLRASQVEAMLRDPEAPGPRFRAPASGLRLFRVHYEPGAADVSGTTGRG